MKIKNRLYISAGISIVLVVTLLSVVLVTSGRVAEGSKKHELLDNVRWSVSELDIVTYDYLLHREKRMENQWNIKHDSLGEILDGLAEEEGLKSIRADYVVLGNLFSQVTENYRERQEYIQEGASQEKIDAATGLEERLVAQLLITSHSIITDASRLAEEAHTEEMEAQRLASNLTVILMIILAITVTTSSLLIARSISKPLDKLTKGADIIGKGELEHKVEVKTKDELGELAASFNKMTENLKKVTASRDELDREVTERKQMQERLLTAERLATLGQFSGSISHELRNPLGVIDSSVYYLKTRLKDADEKVQEHLDRIKSGVGSSTAIIESLLNLTRMKEPRLEVLDLITTTHDTIVTSNVLAAVHVIQNFPEGEVWVNADREQLRMAFTNIVDNAVEAMDGKGTLRVTVRRSTDSQAEVSFADTGPGIALEDLDRVFQPLFSTRAKGIGFGLSIARMVIDKHGGTIEAKSEPGEGATFIIQLPLYIEEAQEVFK